MTDVAPQHVSTGSPDGNRPVRLVTGGMTQLPNGGQHVASTPEDSQNTGLSDNHPEQAGRVNPQLVNSLGRSYWGPCETLEEISRLVHFDEVPALRNRVAELRAKLRQARMNTATRQCSSHKQYTGARATVYWSPEQS